MGPVKLFLKLVTIFLLILSLAVDSIAVAPSDEVINKWKANGTYEKNIKILREFKGQGGCSPVEHSVFNKKKLDERLTLGINVVDTVNVVVIMVDFNDHPWDGQSKAGTVNDFDSILFSNRDLDAVYNPTGSMTDFYLENSYGKFYIKGDIYGWYRMPHNYSYYVNNSFGISPFGISSRDLANDAVTIADNDIDFSLYDHDNDGICDGVIIIHSGPGGEATGISTDIWSHKWDIRSPGYFDGVYVSNYNMNPEELGNKLSPIGVFCHEYGHFLNLPDLYDTNEDHNLSSGLGRWSLMASGSQNGSSRKPAHLDAWCKKEVGFITLNDITSNVYKAEIPQIETEPVAYRLQNSYSNDEYWIVENRQHAGFDVALPGEGLLIYHVKESIGTNNNPAMYMVALEQADGDNALAFNGSRGDMGDPFPGSSNNHNFHEFTTPNTKRYDGLATRIGVWNISDSDSLMTADFDVTYSRPWIVLSGTDPIVFDDSFSGNNDGYMDPGETVEFYFTVSYQMRPSYNTYAALSSSNPGITFIANNIKISGNLGANEINNAGIPIQFTLPDTLQPRIDSFFLTITTDSVDGLAGSNNFSKTFGFEAIAGKPNILIIDDDRGAKYEQAYQQVLYNKRIPSDIWHIDTQGTPDISDLINYDFVFWLTGDSASSVLHLDDIAVMKKYLDNNKSLFLSTVSGAKDLYDLDPAFMADYFHAAFVGYKLYPIINGISGNSISNNTKYIYHFNSYHTTQTLSVVGDGEPVFTIGQDVCGISYLGNHRAVLLSFPVELLDDSRYPGYNKKENLITKVIEFFGGISLSVYDGQPFSQLPKNFDLHQNYPNPFNPTTTISYTLRTSSSNSHIPAKTHLAVYNILGRRVTVLVDKVQVPGTYQVEWKGTDNEGKKVSSGVYFYRLERGENRETKKMILLK